MRRDPIDPVGMPAGWGNASPLRPSGLSASDSTTKNVERPSIATIGMTLGDDESGLTTTTSVAAPAPADTNTPTANANQYGMPYC